MEKISGAFLIILLGAIWLGPPAYWGHINGSFLVALIWPVMAAFTAVGTGWRFRKRNAFISFLYGLVFAAIGVVPVYFVGRTIDLFW